MDLATLKALKPAEYAQAADSYRSTSDIASAAKDRIESQIAAAMRNALKGDAANAAISQLTELGKNFHYVQVECGLVAAALEAFSYEMEAAKRKLDTALADAKAANLTVNADGSVTYPPGGPKGEDGKTPQGGTAGGFLDPTAAAIGRSAANFDPNPHHRAAQDCADLIAAALQEATEADTKWAPKLRALKADDDLTVSDSDWADTSSDGKGVQSAGKEYLDSLPQPPKDNDPKANAQWWKGLTPEERADYLAFHPKAVGEMDGLPAEVRDEANRTVLDEIRGQYRMELASIPAEPTNKYTYITSGGYPSRVYTDEWMAWDEKYGARKGEIEKVLVGADKIQERFDRTGEGGLPEAYLLGFDPKGEGDGRVILANGNPDTADHTAIYVPGTGTNIEGTDGGIKRSEAMWRESQHLVPGQSVSSIYWFDYDAPDSIPQATDGVRAENAGPRLEDFLQGTQTAQGGPDASHTTVIGHSYGSTVIGETAKHHHIPADDIIALGSPGMQVEHARDLGVGADHVWAEGADWSMDDAAVRHGGRLVGLGDWWANPTDESFGANVMQSDTGGFFSGHSSYWDYDEEQASTSLKNQAAVIAGRYGDVKLE
ncbi:alpha/beta hydrolase [Streptomyces niveiscabiei]|uniref:alpha/beta hydrolase n=1 Tax=Streptomyces niveiscabiei TaxID=164115 RepID=UPI0029AB10C1|nr:alpha/beta hydrolase [Streptomyces niveiscabiei]MDX3384632.1 alpha/beta hydrolase [Streptomyces niveiscabiei]